jgi:hypothetical protein
MHILVPFVLAWFSVLQDKPAPATPPAAAPVQDPKPPEKPPGMQGDDVFRTLAKRLTFGGQVRIRAEYRDPTNYTNVPASRRDVDLFMERVRLNFKVDVTDDIEVFIQPQDQRIWGEEASVLTDQKNIDLHQGFVEMRNLLSEPLTLKAGRFEMAYGDQRLVSPLDWSNIARAWDGVKLKYGPPKEWWVEGFYTFIREGVSASQDSDFYGLYSSYVGVEAHEFDAYVFGRSFRNDAAPTGLTGEVGDLRDTTAGARIKGKDFGFDYTAEFMRQWGRFNTSMIQAYAYAATLGYTFPCDWAPRIMVEYTYASGDRNPAHATRNTFDPLFPFAHYYQGYADFFGFKNGRDLAVYLKVSPTKEFSIHLDLHNFWLSESRDAWYNDPGNQVRRDVTGAAGKKLAYETDFHLRWAASKYVNFWGGWSHVFAGPYIRQTPGPDQDMDWFFLQMTVNF